MEQNSIGCGVVRDLLPLYAENLTGGESRALIEAHLPECPPCQAELASIQTPAKPALKAADSLRNVSRRLRRKKAFAAMAAALAVLLVALCAMGFTAKTGVPVTKADTMGVYDHSGIDLRGNSLNTKALYINAASSFECGLQRDVEIKRTRGETDQVEQVVFFTAYETASSRWRNMQFGNQGSAIMVFVDHDTYQDDPGFVYSREPQSSVAMIEGVTGPYPGEELAPQVLASHTKTMQVYFIPYNKWDAFEQLDPLSAAAMEMATLIWDREADEYNVCKWDNTGEQFTVVKQHTAGTPLD